MRHVSQRQADGLPWWNTTTYVSGLFHRYTDQEVKYIRYSACVCESKCGLWCAKKYIIIIIKAIWFCISSSICQERLHAALLLKYTEGRANTVFSKAFNEVICTHESNIMVFWHSDAVLHAWPVERSNKFRQNHVEAHRPANVMSKRSILFNGNPWSGLVLSANGILIFMVFLHVFAVKRHEDICYLTWNFNRGTILLLYPSEVGGVSIAENHQTLHKNEIPSREICETWTIKCICI